MTDATLTPNALVRHLAKLSRELDDLISALKDADYEATMARHDADLAEARAYRAAEGTVEDRKRAALIASASEERAARDKECVVRSLRARIKAVETRIDVGRSASAIIRAEIGLTPYGTEAAS